VVRAAALKALAQRNDRKLLDKIIPSMNDEKDDVQFRAAACVTRLSVSPVAIPVKRAAATPSSAKP
jgi:HEAT repeat protein